VNEKDIETALLFSDDVTDLVLSFETSKDTPYVRRALLKVNGEPDHMNQDYWRYGQLKVWFKPLDSDDPVLKGLPARDFYVDKSKAPQLINGYYDETYKRYTLKGYEMAGLCVIDVYHCLLAMGKTSETALFMMSTAGMLE
jgi:hypothetical protein